MMMILIRIILFAILSNPFWSALFVAQAANVHELGPRYQVLKEYVLSTKRNVRYEATATQTVPSRRRTMSGNVVATAEFFPGIGTQNNASGCIDMDGQHRANGAEYERHNGHFMYRCKNGMEEVTACFGTERTGRARIAVGQTIRIDGYWHKCEKYANGSVIYTQETSCTSGNKDYRVGEEILVGNLRMVCGNLGYSVAGCYFYEGNELYKLGPGEQRQVGHVTHFCEEKNKDTLQYYTRGTGQCVKAGREFDDGESFNENHIRYKCQNGLMDLIGCFIEESRNLAIGQDFVEQNRVHRCYRMGVTVEYTSYVCGYSGGPSCKPPPIPRTPDDEEPVAKSLLSPAVGQLVVSHLLSMGNNGQQRQNSAARAQLMASKFDIFGLCLPRFFAFPLNLLLTICSIILLFQLYSCHSSSAAHHQLRHRQSPPTSKKIECAHGSAVSGRCMCDQGYAGTWCEREMHCGTFERSSDGRCSECKPNFVGDRCEQIVCQNGGKEAEYEQKCECRAPYSGKYCEELLTRNVYFYYNSKVATIGPLGLIAVLPMIGIYLICERYARKRQVRRIEKTWNEQTEHTLNPHRIEQLLKERKSPRH
uniref:EGF-like domain-containing protein n=1 Tax=Globodera rostochiensis TaxID=31243 RepID=A0A914H1L5_GLORO